MGEAFRTEKDALGEVRVPADRLWGAQTQPILSFPRKRESNFLFWRY